MNGPNHFAQQYIALREKEQRIYTPEQIARLPDIDSGHVHYKEWMVRKRSWLRLRDYLLQKRRPLEILESGCGNGWLSAGLASIPASTVTGIDLNETELQQARTVFADLPQLQFLQADIRDPQFNDHSYDVIVFAASIQYFPFLPDILHRALELLKPGGEIHLIDTHFYQPSEVEAAKQRTDDYYAEMGFPGMSAHYFHHTLQALQPFRYQIRFDPRRLFNRLLHKQDRFFWISVNGFE